MICHILFESEYSYRYFRLIEENFPRSAHCFVIHGKGVNFNKSIYEYESSHYTSNFSEPEITSILDNSSSIIINGYFSGNISGYFFDKPNYLKKLNWIIWGEDIFPLDNMSAILFTKRLSFPTVIEQLKIIKWNIQISLANKVIPFRYSIQEIQRNIVIRNMKNIIGVCEGDFKIVKSIYKTQAHYIYAFHPLLFDWKKLNGYLTISDQQKLSVERKFNFLIGNSGSITNQHNQFIKKIQNINIDKINIYCPLSYGDIKYINSVKNYGLELFKNSFIPITQIMNTDEYTKFLARIDVAFMNHNQQEGLGTIITLILLGAKIYMKFNISSYNFLSQRGIKLYNIDEISKSTSGDEIIDYNSIDREGNRQIIIREFSDTAWCDKWHQVFNKI